MANNTPDKRCPRHPEVKMTRTVYDEFYYCEKCYQEDIVNAGSCNTGYGLHYYYGDGVNANG